MKKIYKKIIIKATAHLLVLAFISAYVYALIPGLEMLSPEVKIAEAASAWKIRQEINIVDGYMSAAASAYATSSAIVNLDKTKYSGTVTFYFEVLASTTAGISGDVYLRTTAGATVATASYDTSATSPTLWRSNAFTPNGAADYVAVIDNEAGATKSIKAARIIVLQDFADNANSAATSTQTQIEIGNQELGKTNTANSALSFPKYWKYDSTKWDGTLTAYAEVSYQNTQVASSTTYNILTATTTTRSATYIASPGVSYIQIEAWGGGGGGGCRATDGAAAGGEIAAGTSKALSIGRGGTGDNAAAPAASTYGGTEVVAAAGASGIDGTIGAGGTIANSTGQVEFAGGNGGDQHASDGSGGGGGAGGPNGAGGLGNSAGGTAGASGARGNSTTGGLGGTGGGANPAVHGKYHATGGGGGGGSSSGGTPGGNGGHPGGGAGGIDNNTCSGTTGGGGQIILTETHGMVKFALEEDDGNFGSWTFKKMISTNGGVVSTSTSARIRSGSFTPADGRHYRIVASSTNAGSTYNIYNAKIILDQTSGWTYRKPITIDNAKVPNNNQTDFPVLVDITDSDLAANAQSDGDDIYFTSSNGTTRLDHEIESYTSVSGRLTAWVEVPTLSTSEDTVLYMYYGNGSASSQQNPTGVWDSFSKGVWHLSDNAASTAVLESTSNPNVGAAVANTDTKDTEGKIGNALTFNGTNDHILVTDDNSLDFTTAFTMEGWVKPNAGELDFSMFSKWQLASYSYGMETANDGSGTASQIFIYTDANGDPNNADNCDFVSNAGAITPNQWTHVAIVYNSGSAFKLYINGSSFAGTAGGTCGTVFAGTSAVSLGKIDTNSGRLAGLLDEIRFSSTPRSADWIATEYNNQNATSTFYQIGTAEPTGAGTFTELEPQYLLANTSIGSGTSLQNFITKWDTGEWSGVTNTYVHQVDAADNSTSVLTVNTVGDVLVTGSTVTSPDNRGVSGSMTMPVSGNLDMKATTNNNGVYSSRILVQVVQFSGITLSGVAYQSEGGSVLTNKTIQLYKNGLTSLGSATSDASTGAWSVASLSISSGDIITVYVDNDAVDAGLVYKSDGTAQTNVDLYGSALIVRHDTGASITNANLHTGAIYEETDMVYATSTGDVVTTNSNISLHVWTGDTYKPGGTVSTQGTGSFRVATSSIAFFDTDTNTIGGDIIAYDDSLVYINKNTTVNGGDITTQGTNNTGNILYSLGAMTPTVTLGGTGSIRDGNATSTFYALTISSTGVTTGSTDFVVDNALTVSQSGSLSLSGGTVTANNGASITNSGTLTFSGLTIANSATVTTDASFSVGGALTVGTSANLTPSAGTITMTGGSIVNSGTLALKNLAIAGTVTTGSTFSVTGDMTSSSGTLTTSGGAITVTGDLSVAGTITGTGDITVNGGDVTGAGTLNLTGGTFLLDGSGLFGGGANWTFNKLTFGDGTGASASYSSGSGSITSATTTVTYRHTLDAGVSKTWTLTASHEPFQMRGSFMASSSTFIYTGTSNATVTPTTYYNLEISPSSGDPTFLVATTSSQSLTVNNNMTLGGSGNATLNVNNYDPTLDINGSLTIGTGDVLSASNSGTFTLAGNFTNNGTFTNNSGTVTLDTDGTSEITTLANITFYNLTVTTPAKTLRFQTHSSNVPTFIFDGQFTVTGTLGSPINIQSNAPPSQWIVDFNVGQTAITYANIRDSACLVGSLSVTYSVTNSGGGNNGSCWNVANIGASATGVVTSIEQGSGGGVLRIGGGQGGGGDSGTEEGSGGGSQQGGGGQGGGGGASP
jgi:uncharacterized protein (UPF0333 family)